MMDSPAAFGPLRFRTACFCETLLSDRALTLTFGLDRLRLVDRLPAALLVDRALALTGVSPAAGGMFFVWGTGF